MLRPAGPSDREPLRQLLADYLFEFDGETEPYPYFDAYWSEPERLPFLIEDGEEVVGLCLVRVRDGGWSIAEFYVVPDRRRGGVGRAAVAAIAGLARSAGAAHLEAKVHPDNQQALPFWLSVGFEVVDAPGVVITRRRLTRRILVTGMSGTGKSAALAELERRGFEVVDTDRGGWTAWSDDDGGYVWREDRIAELLDRGRAKSLFVSGTVSNQGRFHDRFDAVVLLHAPAEVVLERIAARTTNDYGKSDEERELVLRHLAEVEPLLRASCTHEIDTAQSLDLVVEQLAAIAG